MLLHDSKTCDNGLFSDVAHLDIDGNARAACMFDTPSLNGLASTPPYMHDGSAPTIQAAVRVMYGTANITPLAPDQEAALIEYLRSL